MIKPKPALRDPKKPGTCELPQRRAAQVRTKIATPPKNARIGYARVSTADQNECLQIDALEAAGCAQIYSDHASGKNIARPELSACLRALRAGDTLIVWRLDRLGRSLRDLIAVVEDLGQRGVSFQSITEQIDTGHAGGRLVFQIFGALAEFERALIRERTLAGLASARARGRKGGRKPKLTAKAMREVKALMRDPDVTVTDVADRFGVARSTIYRHLSRTQPMRTG